MDGRMKPNAMAAALHGIGVNTEYGIALSFVRDPVRCYECLFVCNASAAVLGHQRRWTAFLCDMSA